MEAPVLSIAATPWGLTPPSGLQRHLHSCAHSHSYIHIIKNNKNKSYKKTLNSKNNNMNFFIKVPVRGKPSRSGGGDPQMEVVVGIPGVGLEEE